jgi:hypothetical protein
MPDTFPPGYLADLYGQISSLAAVLGGFAIAALAVLLTAAPEKRVASWATGASAFAAGALISSTFLSAILSTDAGKMNAGGFGDLTPSVLPLVTYQGFLFPLGLYALLFALGLCGWIRSKRTGIASTLAALIGAAAVTAGFAATI